MSLTMISKKKTEFISTRYYSFFSVASLACCIAVRRNHTFGEWYVAFCPFFFCILFSSANKKNQLKNCETYIFVWQSIHIHAAVPHSIRFLFLQISYCGPCWYSIRLLNFVAFRPTYLARHRRTEWPTGNFDDDRGGVLQGLSTISSHIFCNQMLAC